MNFNLHFSELNSDNSINDKNSLFENYIPKCHKVKRILISFNCYSEYTFVTRGNTLELNKPRSRLNIRYNNFSQCMESTSRASNIIYYCEQIQKILERHIQELHGVSMTWSLNHYAAL